MATMTVARARGVLYRAIGEYAALADLNDATARAAEELGFPVAGDRPVDADLAGIIGRDRDAFLKLSELYSWESILGNATDTGLRDVALDESPATVRDAAREKIKSLSGYVKDVYGIGLAQISTGTIGLDFAAGSDDPDGVIDAW